MSSTKSSLLPPLKNMVRPALLTISRGNKIGLAGISIIDQFNAVLIEVEKLRAFKNYFGFDEEVPLPYLYLLAQRAQAALMLQKEYTLAIPGTVHLKNHLKLLAAVDLKAPFRLEVKAEVAYKETGSLLPIFRVDYFQNEQQVAHCRSEYLVKRKNKGAKTKRETPVSNIGEPSFSEEWLFAKDLGKQYAEVSDDHNPIHKSKTLARIAGFKSPIIQGWYCVSKAVQAAQKHQNQAFSQIDVSFYKPVFLPGRAQFSTEKREGVLHYDLQHNGLFLLNGFMI